MALPFLIAISLPCHVTTTTTAIGSSNKSLLFLYLLLLALFSKDAKCMYFIIGDGKRIIFRMPEKFLQFVDIFNFVFFSTGSLLANKEKKILVGSLKSIQTPHIFKALQLIKTQRKLLSNWKKNSRMSQFCKGKNWKTT